MADYEGRSYPTVCPYLNYEEVGAAIDWLVDAFGLTERTRGVRPDGSLGHCEIGIGDGVVMLGAPAGYKSPDHTGQQTHGLYVHVDDVDAHFAHAKGKGARNLTPPADQPYGVRSYGAHDLEGNQWWFAQVLDRTPPADQPSD